LPVAASGRPDVLALDLAGLPLAWPGMVLMAGLAGWLWILTRRDTSAH